MKLDFPGTRGYIKVRSPLHNMHACMKVAYRGLEVLVDCGQDWLGRLDELAPRAIVITHAHPDHAWGVKEGAPCPVYATELAWASMGNFRVESRRIMPIREPVVIGGITFEAFLVDHSIRAPAVGYRITAGKTTIFYGPDLVYIHDRVAALGGASAYVGDGATIVRPMVRRRGEVLFGHVPISTQLTWCKKEGVPRAIFTHCGSQITGGDEREVADKVEELARERGVAVQIAYDGLELTVR